MHHPNAEISDDVSVVIPTHKRLDTLERSLQSVVSQTHQPRSVFVVDDVGDWRVRDLVLSFAETYPVQYVDGSERSTKSAGASRNQGAALSTSTWLAFLDDDDYWLPQFLATAMTEIRGGPARMWACNVFIEHKGNVISNWQRPEVEWDRRALPKGGVSGSNLVVARSVFESVEGYDPNLPVWNDLDLELRLRLAGTVIAVSPQNLVGADADGADHLTSASLRRANGLSLFLAKNGAHMSRGDRRRLRAAMHSSFAHFADGWRDRLTHRTVQAANTWPRDLLRQALHGSSKPFA